MPPFAIQTALIHDNIFNDTDPLTTKGSCIYNRGTFWGVVYNNTFTGYYTITNSFGTIGVYNRTWDNAPQNTLELGSDDALYYEDNTFVVGRDASAQAGIMNGEYAPRYVVRYNDMHSLKYGSSTFDFHGEQATPMDAGYFAEIYGNDYTFDDTTHNDEFVSQRSGELKVFMNNIQNDHGQVGWFDINNSASECPDDDYDLLKMTHSSYYFRNRMNETGALLEISVTATKIDDCAGLDDWPTDGRDVFDDDSTPGIGCGNSLPGTCTEDEGYWLTTDTTMCTDLTDYVGVDPTTKITGSLYVCGASNDWSVAYTPYTYPHPLRNTQKMQGCTITGGVNLQ